MHFTEEQLGDLMVAVQESDQDVSQVTMEWMNENEELINSWKPEGSGEMASVD